MDTLELAIITLVPHNKIVETIKKHEQRLKRFGEVKRIPNPMRNVSKRFEDDEYILNNDQIIYLMLYLPSNNMVVSFRDKFTISMHYLLNSIRYDHNGTKSLWKDESKIKKFVDDTCKKNASNDQNKKSEE